MNQTIIFTDVDGVLNQLQRNYFIDIDCVEILSELCKKLNAKIVLSSTWRLGYSNCGKSSPQVEKLKKIFEMHNIELIGRTPKLDDRGEEIIKYIESHNISRYLILDDDKREFPTIIPKNTYFTNSKYGLTKNDMNEILKLMK